MIYLRGISKVTLQFFLRGYVTELLYGWSHEDDKKKKNRYLKI